MSKTLEYDSLEELSDEDLLYLHQRNLINDQELAEHLGQDEDDVYKLQDVSKGTPLEELPNTGDANTSGLNIERHQRKVERMAKEQGTSLEPGDEDDESDEDDYSTWNKDELIAEITNRNDGRDDADKMSISGNKADLVARLEADDEDEDEE